MSFVSMDPTVREPIDWDNDDTFSVESSNILDNSVVGLEPVKEQLIKEQEAVEEQDDGNGDGDGDYDDDVDDISEVYLETVLEQDSEVDGHDDDEGVIDDDDDGLVDDDEEEVDAVEVEAEVQMKGEATT